MGIDDGSHPDMPDLRAQPHDVQAEMGVIGSMMLHPDALELAAETLTAESFYRLAHQKIFSAVLAVYEARSTLDIILLKSELKRQRILEEVGGVQYLLEIGETVPTSGNVEHYISIVRRHQAMRSLLRLGIHAMKAGADSGEPEALVAELQQFLEDVPMLEAPPPAPKEILEEVEKQIEAASQGEALGVGTGIEQLDRVLKGLRPGSLNVIAARPRDGKSAMMAGISLNVALAERKAVLIFSTEVPKETVYLNMMRILSGIDWVEIKRGTFEGAHYQKWQDARKYLETPLIEVDDTSPPSEQLMRRALRWSKRVEEPGLICVDFLQQVRTAARGKSNERLECVVKQVKAMARNLRVPVLLLSQMRRQQEGEPKYMPKGTGAVEEDADVVIVLVREKQFQWGAEEAEPPVAVRRVKVLKNKMGRETAFKLTFNKPVLRFEELEEEEDGPRGTEGSPASQAAGRRGERAERGASGRPADGAGAGQAAAGERAPVRAVQQVLRQGAGEADRHGRAWVGENGRGGDGKDVAGGPRPDEGRADRDGVLGGGGAEGGEDVPEDDMPF